MATDRQIQHARALGAKRSAIGTVLKKSEKAISDTARLKRETEATNAAALWSKGYKNEPRK